jgi:hypothetical protein
MRMRVVGENQDESKRPLNRRHDAAKAVNGGVRWLLPPLPHLNSDRQQRCYHMALGRFALGCKRAKERFAAVLALLEVRAAIVTQAEVLAVLAVLAARAPIAHIARQEFIGI